MDLIKRTLLGLFAFTSLYSQALETYYGADFFREWHAPHLLLQQVFKTEGSDELRTILHEVLAGGHVLNRNSYDTIVDACDPATRNCIQHSPLSYRNARAEMFGRLYLEEDSGGGYKIKSVYCNKYYHASDFPADRGPGPGQIPYHMVLNAEHTWPQSRFSDDAKEYQKSDLNILFPVESGVNSTRNNHPFGVVETVTSAPCEGAKLGKAAATGDTLIFEPPNNHKGNVARAMFYFAIRYGMNIDPTQEQILRRWHRLDPVDDQERARHEVAFAIQKVRNPFIDYPELIEEFNDL